MVFFRAAAATLLFATILIVYANEPLGNAEYEQPGYAEAGYAEAAYAEAGYAEAGYAEAGYADVGQPVYAEDVPGYAENGAAHVQQPHTHDDDAPRVFQHQAAERVAQGRFGPPSTSLEGQWESSHGDVFSIRGLKVWHKRAEIAELHDCSPKRCGYTDLGGVPLYFNIVSDNQGGQLQFSDGDVWKKVVDSGDQHRPEQRRQHRDAEQLHQSWKQEQQYQNQEAGMREARQRREERRREEEDRRREQQRQEELQRQAAAYEQYEGHRTSGAAYEQQQREEERQRQEAEAAAYAQYERHRTSGAVYEQHEGHGHPGPAPPSAPNVVDHFDSKIDAPHVIDHVVRHVDEPNFVDHVAGDVDEPEQEPAIIDQDADPQPGSDALANASVDTFPRDDASANATRGPKPRSPGPPPPPAPDCVDDVARGARRCEAVKTPAQILWELGCSFALPLAILLIARELNHSLDGKTEARDLEVRREQDEARLDALRITRATLTRQLAEAQRQLQAAGVGSDAGSSSSVIGKRRSTVRIAGFLS